jgi:hypothetical protein
MNLKIGIPDIPGQAYNIDSSDDFGDSELGARKLYNVLARNRYSFAKSEDSNTDAKWIRVQLADGVAKRANFVFVANGATLSDQGLNQLKLQRSSNGSSWTDQHTLGTPNKGLQAKDYFEKFDLSDAFQWWRLLASFTTAGVWHTGPIMFGELLTLSQAPFSSQRRIVDDQGAFITDANTAEYEQVGTLKRAWQFSFEGLNHSDIDILEQRIIPNANRHSFVLHTEDNTNLLQGSDVAHVELIGDPRIGRPDGAADWYTLDIEFMELLG